MAPSSHITRKRRFLVATTFLQVANAYCRERQRFVRIIDGGSTGSRLHTFEYGENHTIQTVKSSNTHYIDTPLSDYVESTPYEIRQHLLPLFPPANELSNHSIPCYYGATAGMRLVTESQQQRTYEKMLSLNDVPEFQKNVLVDAFTLSGTDEAYYGALAANHILRSSQLAGALDIGGASTQLVHPLSDDSLEKDNFYSISLLGYGVDQFQQRLFRERPRPDNKNPCMNQGYLPNATGNATECRNWIAPLLETVPEMIETTLSESREYIAMSLYFFSFDALRHFTKDANVNQYWPTPNLSQLESAGETLCAMSWDELQGKDSHAFTRNDKILSKRCFEAVYLVELLRAMGFSDSFTIRYMFQSESGDEVEWTLGMALALRESITSECLDDQEQLDTTSSKTTNERNNNNYTENNHGANVTWAQRLASVLSADDILAR